MRETGCHDTVLIADDEPEIRNVLQRYLASHGYDSILACDGREALGKAKVQNPSLILLDINMPQMDGYTVCQKLRENPATQLTPILMLTARVTTDDKVAGFANGADDYLPKPFDLPELLARIESLLKRTRKMIAVNPLTRLPGVPVIQEEIESQIALGKKFGVAYIDIDQFKAYNDVYGYHQGDRVIQSTASLIQSAVRSYSMEEGRLSGFSAEEPLCCHIGGDDFILIAPLKDIRTLCEKIAQNFDAVRKQWYNWLHSARGYIETEDRQGASHRFPLMTLSIGVSTNEIRELRHYAQVAQIVSELKKFAKTRADKNRSHVVFDRRKD